MKSLVGNADIGKALQRFVGSGRLPNALVFTGPDGVGKKQYAIELSRILLCTARHDGGACDECSACRRVGEFSIPTFEKGEESDRVFFSHPDVGLVVPFRRNLRIGAIRELEREANFRPYESSTRVFIVNDADKMNEAASNALLKTLEEPPSTSHIILVTSRADKLLATIRSRCQTIRFAPVPREEIEKYLLESGHFSPEDAALAARVSRGSIGRARAFVPASFRTQRSLMLSVLTAAVSGSHRDLLAGSEEMNDAKNKEEYDENLAILETLIHDTWLLKNGIGREEILNTGIAGELEALADAACSPKLAAWLGEIETMRENFIVNLNRKIATDALLVKMAA